MKHILTVLLSIIAGKGSYDQFDGKIKEYRQLAGESFSIDVAVQNSGMDADPTSLLVNRRFALDSISLGDLYNRTRDEVEAATAVSGKLQSPQVPVSPDWTDWSTKVLK